MKLFKKLLLVCALTTIGYAAHATEWVVLIWRKNYMAIVVVTKPPFPGEGVYIAGPFPDGTYTRPNQAPPFVINNTTVTAGLTMPKDKVTSDNKGSATFLVYFTGDNTISIVKSNTTLTQGTYSNNPTKKSKMKGCKTCETFFVVKGEDQAGALQINNVAVSYQTAPVTIKLDADKKHGDILIDNVPIEGY